MTFYDAYIADIEGQDWTTISDDLPTRIGPYFPALVGGGHMYGVIRSMDSTQVEWGGWMIRVSKKDIIRILDECYGRNKSYSPQSELPHLYEKFQELSKFVDSLEEDHEYGLVGTEF